MKTLIGGAIAAVLGLIGISVWFGEFLQIIAGIFPAALLLGGGLALYLGFDELKDKWKTDRDSGSCSTQSGDMEKYKTEIDQLKNEVDALKNNK